MTFSLHQSLNQSKVVEQEWEAQIANLFLEKKCRERLKLVDKLEHQVQK